MLTATETDMITGLVHCKSTKEGIRIRRRFIYLINISFFFVKKRTDNLWRSLFGTLLTRSKEALFVHEFCSQFPMAHNSPCFCLRLSKKRQYNLYRCRWHVTNFQNFERTPWWVSCSMISSIDNEFLLQTQRVELWGLLCSKLWLLFFFTTPNERHYHLSL